MQNQQNIKITTSTWRNCVAILIVTGLLCSAITPGFAGEREADKSEPYTLSAVSFLMTVFMRTRASLKEMQRHYIDFILKKTGGKIGGAGGTANFQGLVLSY